MKPLHRPARRHILGGNEPGDFFLNPRAIQNYLSPILCPAREFRGLRYIPPGWAGDRNAKPSLGDGKISLLGSLVGFDKLAFDYLRFFLRVVWGFVHITQTNLITMGLKKQLAKLKWSEPQATVNRGRLPAPLKAYHGC